MPKFTEKEKSKRRAQSAHSQELLIITNVLHRQTEEHREGGKGRLREADTIINLMVSVAAAIKDMSRGTWATMANQMRSEM